MTHRWILACLANAFACDVLAADIVIGWALPLTGPIGAYGNVKMEGADLLINAVNAKGGISGRKLVAVPLDDRYDPEQTVTNVRELDGDRKALGVPAIARLLPLLEKFKLPRVGFSLGFVTVRLLRAIGFDRVAMVKQDDLSGKSVADAYRAELQIHGMRLSDSPKVLRDRPDVISAVAMLQLPARAHTRSAAPRGGAWTIAAWCCTPSSSRRPHWTPMPAMPSTGG